MMTNWLKILGRTLLGRFEDPPEPTKPVTEAPVDVPMTPPPNYGSSAAVSITPETVEAYSSLGKKKPTLEIRSSVVILAVPSANGEKLHVVRNKSSNSPLLCGAKRRRGSTWRAVTEDDDRLCKNCLNKSPNKEKK